MPYDTDAFRETYRAGIRPGYSAWLHGGFVFACGTACLAWLGLQLSDVQPLEWLAVPPTLVFFNFGEYAVHRFLGHEKRAVGKLFYRRHTGDHHSFFVETRMRYEQSRDFRVILFPAWLVVVYTLGLVLPAYLAFGRISTNVGALVGGSMMLGYLVYEFFHTTQHLPDDHPLARLPWIRTMRRHHAIHHRRSLMTRYNFNLVAPLMDVVFGTLYRGDEHDDEDRER